jgi:hypothetical protein
MKSCWEITLVLTENKNIINKILFTWYLKSKYLSTSGKAPTTNGQNIKQILYYSLQVFYSLLLFYSLSEKFLGEYVNLQL